MFLKFVYIFLLACAASCNYRHDKLSESKFPLEISKDDLSFTTIKEGILKTRCIDCHSAGHSASHIPFETREDLIDSPLDLVIPGNLEDSGLMIAITRTDSKRMPPPDSGMPSLTAEEIDVIRQWILEGATK